jgi:hypothetical protein
LLSSRRQRCNWCQFRGGVVNHAHAKIATMTPTIKSTSNISAPKKSRTRPDEKTRPAEAAVVLERNTCGWSRRERPCQ